MIKTNCRVATSFLPPGRPLRLPPDLPLPITSGEESPGSLGSTVFISFACLLDITKKAWEEQSSLYKSLVDHIQEMQERTDKVTPIVKKNTTVQVELQEFKHGSSVLLLLPCDHPQKFTQSPLTTGSELRELLWQ